MEPFVLNLVVLSLAKLIADPITENLGNDFKREQAAIQFERQVYLEKLKEEASLAMANRQMEHAEKMFKLVKEKELEILALQFDQQRKIIQYTVKSELEKKDKELALTSFPLNLRPFQLLDSPQALLLIVKHKTQNAAVIDAEDGSVHKSRVVSVDHRLSGFLQESYGLGGTHPVIFPQDCWKSNDQRGEGASLSLYASLKSRPTLLIEYELIENQIIVNVSYWRANEEKYHFSTFAGFPVLPYIPYSDEKTDENFAEENIRYRLSSLQALAVGIIADVYYMNSEQSSPLLPAKIHEILGDKNDPFVIEAVNKVLSGYLFVLSEMKKLVPHKAAAISLDISDKLKELSDINAIKSFYEFSLKTFIEARGSSFDENSDLLDQAAAVQFEYDEDFFGKAKNVRQVLFEKATELPERISKIHLINESSFEVRLKVAKKALGNIIRSVNKLDSESPEDLNKFLKDFDINKLLSSLRESLDSLKNPVFRMIPVGVTNSGKSTLAAAILGRNLLPRGSGEVSMGVLRFIHRPSGLLVREIWPSTDEAVEDNIVEKSYSSDSENADENISRLLKEKMTEYSDNGFIEGQPFPRFEIETPILPGIWSEMFSLPENVSFEFADVPGLNSTDSNDKNLSIIQQEIIGGFCIFILDWNTSNPSRDLNLLNLIKETLRDSGADKESIIFVLNKFDERDGSDSPEDVTRRISQFRKILRKELDLYVEPEVITMSGRLWFYGQIGWGARSPDDAPLTNKELRNRMLESLLTDEARTLKRIDKSDPKYQWIREKLTTDDGENLTPEDYRYLLQEIVYVESGANDFRQAVIDKIKRRGASLIIRPLVNKALSQSQIFLSAIKRRYKDAQIQNRDEITDEIRRIKTSIRELKRCISETVSEIENVTGTVIPKIVNVGSDTTIKPEYEEAYEKYGKNLESFLAITKNIRTDLADNIAKPFRTFDPNTSVPNSWNDVLQKKRVESLSRAAQNYFNLTRVYREKGSEQVELASLPSAFVDSQIKEAENAYQLLMTEIVEAMDERCRYELQRHLSVVISESQGLLTNFYETIKATAAEVVRDTDLIDAILKGLEPKLTIETLINISLEKKLKTVRRTETRSALVTETAVIKTAARKTVDSFKWLWRRVNDRQTDDLFKTVTKQVFRDRQHTVSVLPSREGIQNQVNEIFELYTTQLRKELMGWLTELLQEYADNVSETAQLLSDSLSEALEAQREKSEAERLNEIEKWKALTPILDEGFSNIKSLQISFEYK